MDRTQLGPYVIRDKLGEGGMGEVYLADDTRLGREVAIKVLPVEFASDPERLARFEQEARAAAALNHPHIAGIYDVGAEDGIHYIVQEYLRGQTLADELAARRMTLERALELGVELAEALGAAHAAGIVHRDLKPANIFATEQGHAKILDFGLAKLTDLTPVGSADDSKTQSPTMLGTVAGQVMGTAGYMAPEQVEGGEIDGRSDIFAFGCVFYEMLAGSRPFSGRSLMQTLDLIVHVDPAPVAEKRQGLPRKIQWVLDKCLAKDPKRRYQDAEDLVVDLRWIATADSTESAAAVSPPGVTGASTPRQGISPLVAAVAGLVLIAGTFLAARDWRSEPADAPLMHLGFSLPPDVRFSSLGRRAIAINPQGTKIAFTADDQIWLRSLDDTVAVPLRGTEGGGRAPEFSPDGEHVLFWRGDALRRVTVAGGLMTEVTAADNPWGTHWYSEEWILYGQGANGIWRVRAGGGDPEQLVVINSDHVVDSVQWLGADRVLYTRKPVGGAWDDAEVVVQRLDGEPEVIFAGGRGVRWLDDGILLFARGGDLFARRWDGAAALGPVVPVSTGVQSGREITGAAHYDVSDLGTLVYMPGDVAVTDGSQLLWRGRDATLELTPLESLPMDGFAMSPDGARVALKLRTNAGSDLWIYDLTSGAGTLIAAGGILGSPVWPGSGRWIYYSATVSAFDFGDVYRVAADGSGVPEALLRAGDGYRYRPAEISADGGTLFLEREREDRSSGIWQDIVLFDVETQDLTLVADPATDEQHPRLDPTGRFLAYASITGGFVGAATPRLQVRDLETGATYPVAPHAALYSRWSADGTELFYVQEGENTADMMMRVPVLSRDPFALGPAERLFDLDISLGGARDFFVTADGNQFLYAELPGSIAGMPEESVRVVANWKDYLRARVPLQ